MVKCKRVREGGSKQIDAMLSDEGRGTLFSYRPCTVDESEVNAARKLGTRGIEKRSF